MKCVETPEPSGALVPFTSLACVMVWTARMQPCTHTHTHTPERVIETNELNCGLFSFIFSHRSFSVSHTNKCSFVLDEVKPVITACVSCTRPSSRSRLLDPPPPRLMPLCGLILPRVVLLKCQCGASLRGNLSASDISTAAPQPMGGGGRE